MSRLTLKFRSIHHQQRLLSRVIPPNAGDKVFSRFTWHGTHRGEFCGVPATGRQITVKGMVVDRVVAGKMADSRILMDGLGMMTQLGVIPAEKAVG
jgi:predicted ester cyclase